MGAADFDDGGECFGFFVQCVAQGFYRRNKVAVDFNRGGDVDGGRERVIGRLRVVHMVVGMDGLIRRQTRTGDFVGAVCQHFVHVHIGLRAGTGLPHYQWELPVKLAVQHIICRLRNQICLFGLNPAEGNIGGGCGFFYQRQSINQRLRQGFAADFEIVAAALGLRAPIGFGRDFDIAHGVVFGTGTHAFLLYLNRNNNDS